MLLGLGIPAPSREDINVPFRIPCGTGTQESACVGQGA